MNVFLIASAFFGSPADVPVPFASIFFLGESVDSSLL